MVAYYQDQYIWSSWSSSATTSSHCTNNTWTTWTTSTNSISPTSLTSSTTAWYYWTESALPEHVDPDYTYYQPPVAPDVGRWRDVKEKKAVSEQKACELLGGILGDKQLEIYKKSKMLLVEGKKQKYLLNGGDLGYRLRKIDEAKRQMQEFCIHLENPSKYPPTDHVLSILLSLMNNEKEVLKKANDHGIRPYTQLPEAARITLH